MTDEVSVQKNQPSTTPYVLGGATVGGLGAGVGTHYWAKPKYGSYEDIIKEAENGDSFKTKIEEATGDRKTFLEDVKNLADERNSAEKKYNEMFEEFKKTAEMKKDVGVEKTVEELEAEFLKSKGYDSKAKYIDTQVEEKANIFKEKWAKELESKLGKNAGWKLAGITAGGLVLGSLIGKMFAPKREV